MSLFRVPTPIGTLTIVAGQTGLTRILWDGEDPPDGEEPAGAKPPDGEEPAGAQPRDDGSGPGEESLLATAARQITEYFAGSRKAFEVPLELGGTAFQQAAWLELAAIPYGSTISYAEQARRIGRCGAARAIGSANSRNPVPIVLPCHRVIGAGGALTGFGGGLQVKRALLDHESRVLGGLHDPRA